MSVIFKKDDVLIINRKLTIILGLNDAVVLQQIAYWLEGDKAGIEHDGRRWIYNTHEQWAEQFPFWSIETVRRSLASLQKQGLIIVRRLNAASRDQTNYYSIDHAVADQLQLVKMTNSEVVKLTSSISSNRPPVTDRTETTTKTTELTVSNDVEIAFETFWSAGMVKTAKKKALSAFTSCVKRSGLTAPEFGAKLAADVKMRIEAGQFGFDKLHPTSYLNGERWNDAAPRPSQRTSKPSSHAGFGQKNYSEGINDDGSF